MKKKMSRLFAALAAVLLLCGMAQNAGAGSIYAFAEGAEESRVLYSAEESGKDNSQAAPLPTASEDDIPETGASAGLTSIVAILFATACIVVKKQNK